jgi:hypothetical protein
MQNLFYKMVVASVALGAWVVYDRWEDWTVQASVAAESATSKMSTVVQSSLPTEPPEVTNTTVYKWQDAKGRWHFGDAPPAKAKNAQKETYSSDRNLMPRISAEEIAFLHERDKKAAKKDAKPGGIVNAMVNGVKQAKDLQDTLNDRAAHTQQQLDNAR